MSKKEYYFCYIGPTDRNELDKKFPMGEGRLRASIQVAFEEVTGHYAKRCGSGWGIIEGQTYEISFATYDKKNKIAIINSYKQEKKKMPNYVKAWALFYKIK